MNTEQSQRTQRVFTTADQVAFARLSGDYNPMHLDPIAARRLIFGAPVVHGIHALLWALDTQLKAEPLRLTRLKATFASPMEVGEPVHLSPSPKGDGAWTLHTAQGPAVTLHATYETDSRRLDTVPAPSVAPPPRRACRTLESETLDTVSGRLPLHLDPQACAALFPTLSQHLPAGQIAVLLASTRLVGMECPGLNSVYAELNFSFDDSASGEANLDYAVRRFDPRFSLVTIGLESPGMEGTIKAFVRPPPCQQADYASLAARVEPNVFAGTRALVLGGSRGIGEVTAKLLAAGGATVRLTYHQGADDARRVVDEITQGGGVADCARFDVCAPTAFEDEWCPTLLCYFASPFIFKATRGAFSPSLFADFCAFYVTGLWQTIEAFGGRDGSLRGILYPSSVALDELPLHMGEYSMAKAAGETLCAYIEKVMPNVCVARPRFPRIATDQTASLRAAEGHDPVPILLASLGDLAAR